MKGQKENAGGIRCHFFLLFYRMQDKYFTIRELYLQYEQMISHCSEAQTGIRHTHIFSILNPHSCFIAILSIISASSCVLLLLLTLVMHQVYDPQTNSKGKKSLKLASCTMEFSVNKPLWDKYYTMHENHHAALIKTNTCCMPKLHNLLSYLYR